MLSPSDEGTPAPGAMLKNLKGIGPEFADVLWSEGLFRSFSNRRQVAAYAGLAPTPWRSGSVAHEQGVSKAGNPRLRTTMIQPAWSYAYSSFVTKCRTHWAHHRRGRHRLSAIPAEKPHNSLSALQLGHIDVEVHPLDLKLHVMTEDIG